MVGILLQVGLGIYSVNQLLFAKKGVAFLPKMCFAFWINYTSYSLTTDVDSFLTTLTQVSNVYTILPFNNLGPTIVYI